MLRETASVILRTPYRCSQGHMKQERVTHSQLGGERATHSVTWQTRVLDIDNVIYTSQKSFNNQTSRGRLPSQLSVLAVRKASVMENLEQGCHYNHQTVQEPSADIHSLPVTFTLTLLNQ